MNNIFVRQEDETIDKPSNENKPKDTGRKKLLNIDFFLNDKKNTSLSVLNGENVNPVKKKKTKNVTPKEPKQKKELSMVESNKPYDETYNDTTNMLKASIMDIDIMQNEIHEDINAIRNSKTIKKKYDYISEMASTRGSLINTKITAIREINNCITNAHNLELKRIKDLKLNQDEKDDDKYLMDMYKAYISTPIGNRININPSVSDMTVNVPNMMPQSIESQEYQDIMNNGITPVQNMMRIESNANVKTVVVYDLATGNRWFDVVDIATGNSIPNSEKPDPMFLEDIRIDLKNSVARNTNLNIDYPLIKINNKSESIYTEY